MDYIIVRESAFYFNFVICEESPFIKLEPVLGIFNVSLLISCSCAVTTSCGKLCVCVRKKLQYFKVKQ